MKARIVIVDDNPMMKTFLTTFLGKEYDAVGYSHPKEFVDSLDTEPEPAVVVLDLKMPGMSGFEVLKIMGYKGLLSRVRVVVVSAVEESADRVRCLEMGANDFLVKPFNPQELAARIAHQIKITSTQAQ